MVRRGKPQTDSEYAIEELRRQCGRCYPHFHSFLELEEWLNAHPYATAGDPKSLVRQAYRALADWRSHAANDHMTALRLQRIGAQG